MDTNLDIFLENYIEHRKFLLKEDAIPELNEIFENHGKKRGDLIISGMSKNARELLKTDYRFSFDVTDGTWWVPPESRVNGNPCLQKSSNIELTKACLHQNVVAIGKIIEENLERKNISQMIEALQGIIEFERSDCKKRCDFNLKQQRLYYLTEIEEMMEKHEQDIKIIRMCVESHFKTEYEKIIHDLNEKHEEEICKCNYTKKEEITSTESDKISSKEGRLPSSSSSLSSEQPEIPDIPNFRKEDKQSIPWADVENHLRFQKHLQEMKNASSLIHLICAEKKHYKDRVKKIEYSYKNLLAYLKKSLYAQLRNRCVIECKCPKVTKLPCGKEIIEYQGIETVIDEVFEKSIKKYKPEKENEVNKILNFLKDECSMIIPKKTADLLFCQCNDNADSSDTLDPTYAIEKKMLLCTDDLVDIKWDEVKIERKLPSSKTSSLDSMTSSDFVVNVDDIRSTSSSSSTENSKTSNMDNYDFSIFVKYLSSVDFNGFVQKVIQQFETVNTKSIDFNSEIVSLFKKKMNSILDLCQDKSKIVESKSYPEKCPGVLDRCPGAPPIRVVNRRCLGTKKKINKKYLLIQNKLRSKSKDQGKSQSEATSICACTQKLEYTKEEYQRQFLDFPKYMIPIHMSIEEKEAKILIKRC